MLFDVIILLQSPLSSHGNCLIYFWQGSFS